jgi:hypothetical protein
MKNSRLLDCGSTAISDWNKRRIEEDYEQRKVPPGADSAVGVVQASGSLDSTEKYGEHAPLDHPLASSGAVSLNQRLFAPRMPASWYDCVPF